MAFYIFRGISSQGLFINVAQICSGLLQIVLIQEIWTCKFNNPIISKEIFKGSWCSFHWAFLKLEIDIKIKKNNLCLIENVYILRYKPYVLITCFLIFFWCEYIHTPVQENEGIFFLISADVVLFLIIKCCQKQDHHLQSPELNKHHLAEWLRTCIRNHL